MAIRSGFAVTPGAVVSLPPGGVTTPDIQDGSITNPKLANNAVTSGKIADGTIVGADVAVNSIPADRLVDGSIDPAKLGPGAIPKSKLGPLGIVDADVTGPISGAKIATPVKQQVQFNGAAVPVETVLNFLGTAGLLDIADDPGNGRTNINLQGIITNAPAKGTDGQVLPVGDQAGNTIGAASTWAGSDHGHQLVVRPIGGNPATLPFGPASPGAADATLKRTAAGALQLDTVLGVGVAPTLMGPAGTPTLEVGQAMAVRGTAAATHFAVTLNSLLNAAGTLNLAKVAGAGSQLAFAADGSLAFINAPAVGAGATQAMSTRLSVGATGTVTLTPDAGAVSLYLAAPDARLHIGGNGQGFSATPTTNGIELMGYTGPMAVFKPVAAFSGAASLGTAGNPFAVVYATNGAIQPSSETVKEAIAPLPGADAIAAVRQTDAVTFAYKPAPVNRATTPRRAPGRFDWRQERENTLNRLRLTAARRQAGFVAEQAAGLFLTGEGQSTPSNTAGVLLAALKDVDARLQALEGVS